MGKHVSAGVITGRGLYKTAARRQSYVAVKPQKRGIKKLKIVQNKSHYDFKIKIGNNYITVATLHPWLFSKHNHKYNLYFFYYGAEYEEGTYSCCHRNGNEKIVVYEQEDELHKEFLKRVTRTVSKKLYVIGTSIVEEIKYIEE